MDVTEGPCRWDEGPRLEAEALSVGRLGLCKHRVPIRGRLCGGRKGPRARKCRCLWTPDRPRGTLPEEEHS